MKRENLGSPKELSPKKNSKEFGLGMAGSVDTADHLKLDLDLTSGTQEDSIMSSQDHAADHMKHSTSLSAVGFATPSKATPGPWKAVKQRHHDNMGWQWVLDSETRSGMAILEVEDLSEWAKCRGYSPEHEETMEEVAANAALIAAAPELLEALIGMVSIVLDDYPCTDPRHEEARKANEIIKKATT